jgi:hypothetical protein
MISEKANHLWNHGLAIDLIFLHFRNDSPHGDHTTLRNRVSIDDGSGGWVLNCADVPEFKKKSQLIWKWRVAFMLPMPKMDTIILVKYDNVSKTSWVKGGVVC